jgi:hypothetical protein
MYSRFADENRITARIREVEERGQAHRLALVSQQTRRVTGRAAIEVRHATDNAILLVTDRAAERSLDDVSTLHALGGEHEPRLLVRVWTAQDIDQLDEHPIRRQLRERRTSSTSTSGGWVTA